MPDLDIPDYYVGDANASFTVANVLAGDRCLVQAFKRNKLLVFVMRLSSRSIRGALVAAAGQWSGWIF